MGVGEFKLTEQEDEYNSKQKCKLINEENPSNFGNYSDNQGELSVIVSGRTPFNTIQFILKIRFVY